MSKKVFRAFEEYQRHYSPKPKRIRGSKWYRMGVEIARQACEKARAEEPP